MYPQNQLPPIMTPSSNTCPACGTEMGINPTSGKLGCPHIACCYTKEIPINQTKIIAMQHIITDEEAQKAYKLFSDYDGGAYESIKAVLTDFLNNRPQVAQLRPIAEMSEKPAEGCVRMFWAADKGWWSAPQGTSVTHAVDIQLPTPDADAEERRQFEEAMKDVGHWDFKKHPSSEYEFLATEIAWMAWMRRAELAKKGGDK